MKPLISKPEKPIMDFEAPDFFGKRGCCRTCIPQEKEDMEGFQLDVYWKGKHYSCLCFECQCTKCMWYFDRHCQWIEKGLPYY